MVYDMYMEGACRSGGGSSAYLFMLVVIGTQIWLPYTLRIQAAKRVIIIQLKGGNNQGTLIEQNGSD